MCHIDYPSTREIRSIPPLGAHHGIFAFVFVFLGGEDCAESPKCFVFARLRPLDGDKRAVHTNPRFGGGSAARSFAAATVELIV